MYLGLDIGGTSIKYGLVNDKGVILEKSKLSTQEKKKSLLEDIYKIVKKYQMNYDIKGIGLSVPGIVQKNGFLLTGGAIQEFYGLDLKRKIEQKTGLYTVVENDANAVAIAEQWMGNAVGKQNYVCLVLGTGVGGGIVINGDIYRGAHGMAGEFGYMVIEDFENDESPEEQSLNRKAAVVGGLYYRYNLEQQKEGLEVESTINAVEIMKRANRGEGIAVKVMNKFYQDISVGILNLIAVYDPELVLIGGGISANKEFIKELKQNFKQIISRHDSLNFLKDKAVAEVKSAKLRNDAGIVGAVYQVKKSLNNQLKSAH